MPVERLSKKSLKQILAGQLKEVPAFIVVKFYSNGCHYCQALQEDYEKMAEEDEETFFFAFNIDDQPSIQDILNFKGVPTICTIAVDRRRPRVRVLPEPKKPHPKKWYHPRAIKDFINKEKIKNEY